MLPVKKDVFLFQDSLFTDAASPRKKKNRGAKSMSYFEGRGRLCTG